METTFTCTLTHEQSEALRTLIEARIFEAVGSSRRLELRDGHGEPIGSIACSPGSLMEQWYDSLVALGPTHPPEYYGIRFPHREKQEAPEVAGELETLRPLFDGLLAANHKLTDENAKLKKALQAALEETARVADALHHLDEVTLTLWAEYQEMYKLLK